MSETPSSFAALHRHVIELSKPIRDTLLNLPSNHQNLSLKPTLLSLLSLSSSSSVVVDFSLCCAVLASGHLDWVPLSLSTSAESAFKHLSEQENEFAVELVCEVLPLLKNRVKESCVGDDVARVPVEVSVVSAYQLRWLVNQFPRFLPLLKDRVKESLIGDDVARVPVEVTASHQLRWLVSQVEYPHLGNLCHLIIPCALTCLDHWSPEVKGQGMICFINLGKSVNASELDVYGDVILDACCQNIASADEIWHLVVEMSVIMVTNIQRNNPRSSWFEKMLNEMLGHLERQPRNKERRLAWLKHIEPVFNVLGLVLLAHFRRLIPLFFQWMHVDDDETILLVLQQLHTVLTLTWIRNTPYVERLVEELAALYKNAALKVAREEIRSHILKILILLQHSKGLQFKSAWDKHKNDTNLQILDSLLITGEVQAVQ